MAMTCPAIIGVFPPSQQRGSVQAYQVNASGKANSLPRGILTGPHSQRVAFFKEAFQYRVLRKAHGSEHCLETPDVLQRRGNLGLRWQLGHPSETPSFLKALALRAALVKRIL